MDGQSGCGSDQSEKSFIIFGASGGGKKVFDLLEEIADTKVCFFLDNFPKQEFFCGIPVVKADGFLNRQDRMDYIYIVAGAYRDAMEKQLAEHGIPEQQIWSKADIVKLYWNVYMEKIKIGQANPNDKDTVIFDCGEGFVLGGVERWSYDLSRRLMQEHYDIVLLSNHSDKFPPDDLSQFAYYLSRTDDFGDYQFDSVQEIADVLVKHLPCTLIAAHVDDFLIASMLVKQQYPDDVKVVSVVHGGLSGIIRDNVVLEDKVDYILCVSNDCYSVFVEKYKLDLHKVLYKETPTGILDTFDHVYNISVDKPLLIGYAARLEKIHKHAELVIPLLEELEKRKISYVLDIAGEGSVYGRIDEYIESHCLIDHVHMLGTIPYTQMTDFWKQHDIAINLSECEGCSLAMLESMAAGAVPVFTDVFSSRYFIHDSSNGFVVPYGDIGQMADRIEYLSNHRQMIEEMGKRAYDEICHKCRMEDYIAYIKKHILEIGE